MKQGIKQLSVALLSMAATSGAFAGQAYYAGIATGPDMGSWFETNNVTGFSSEYNRLRGWDPDVFAGMRATFDWFNLGVEGVWVPATNSQYVDDSTTAGTEREYLNFSWNLSALPGATVNGQRLFVRAGAEWANLQYKTNVTALAPANFERTEIGYVFGFGLEAPIADHFFVRSEYDYSDFEHINRGATGGHIQFDPERDVFMLGVAWDFYPDLDDEENVKPNIVGLSDGFEVGGALIRDLARLREQVTTPANAILTDRLGANGMGGQVLFGYLRQFHHIVGMGIETTASYSGADYHLTAIGAPANSFNIQLQDRYGISGRLGFDVSGADQLFVTAGWTIAHFKKSGGTLLGPNYDTYRNGYVLGVGNQLAVMPRLAVRLEATYAGFGEFKAGVGGDGNTYRIRPSDTRFIMGADYFL